MLFSHFLPSVRWNVQMRTLEVTFKPFENNIAVFSSTEASVCIGFTES